MPGVYSMLVRAPKVFKDEPLEIAGIRFFYEPDALPVTQPTAIRINIQILKYQEVNTHSPISEAFVENTSKHTSTVQ